jgi:hypothetical protein
MPENRRITDSHESVDESALTMIVDEAFTMRAEPNRMRGQESRRV